MTFLQTVVLVYGEKHFPAKTPRRWHLIAEFVGKFTSEVPHNVAVSICIGAQDDSETVVPFQSSADLCRLSFGLIASNHPQLLSFAECQASILLSDPSYSADSAITSGANLLQETCLYQVLLIVFYTVQCMCNKMYCQLEVDL